MKLPPSIVKVLETFAQHRLQVLLMGGQACIVYGGAEFSRDIDFAILASSENLEALNLASRRASRHCPCGFRTSHQPSLSGRNGGTQCGHRVVDSA